jgi:quinolinate synthase
MCTKHPFDSSHDKFVRETPQKVVIMATEVANIHPLSKAAPGKLIIPATPEAVCTFMKQNRFRKLYLSRHDAVHEITVEPAIAERARLLTESSGAVNSPKACF